MQTIYSIGDVVDDDSKGDTGKVVGVEVCEDAVFYCIDCYSELPPEIAVQGHPDDQFRVIETKWLKPVTVTPVPRPLDAVLADFVTLDQVRTAINGLGDEGGVSGEYVDDWEFFPDTPAFDEPSEGATLCVRLLWGDIADSVIEALQAPAT